MKQLLKLINYAAQLMTLIDFGKSIKRCATKNQHQETERTPLYFPDISNIAEV